MTLIGAKLEQVEPGAVDISIEYRRDLTQQHGYLHAAVTSAIADSACGYAAMTLTPEGCEVLSVEFKVNLLRPAAGERFVAQGRVLKAGRDAHRGARRRVRHERRSFRTDRDDARHDDRSVSSPPMSPRRRIREKFPPSPRRILERDLRGIEVLGIELRP